MGNQKQGFNQNRADNIYYAFPEHIAAPRTAATAHKMPKGELSRAEDGLKFSD